LGPPFFPQGWRPKKEVSLLPKIPKWVLKGDYTPFKIFLHRRLLKTHPKIIYWRTPKKMGYSYKGLIRIFANQNQTPLLPGLIKN